MTNESASTRDPSSIDGSERTKRSSLWSPSKQRLWTSVAEFPFSIFALAATGLGVIVALRYLGKV